MRAATPWVAAAAFNAVLALRVAFRGDGWPGVVMTWLCAALVAHAAARAYHLHMRNR